MHVVILVTISSVKEVGQIAQTLLEKRLAACTKIVPRVRSRFSRARPDIQNYQSRVEVDHSLGF